MNKLFAIKIGVILLIALLLNIPLDMVASKTYERSAYKQEAFDTIANSWTGEQKVTGPIIQIPYIIEQTGQVWDEKLKAYRQEVSHFKREHWIVADDLSITGEVDNSSRYRGIYKVPVYSAKLKFNGAIKSKAIANIQKIEGFVKFGTPVFSFALSDSRGISRISPLVITPVDVAKKDQQQTLDFLPSSELAHEPNGIHTLIDASTLANPVTFSFTLDLQGMASLNFAPTAKQVAVELASAWPHPSFIGNYLPAKREITEQGYSAHWQVSSLASNIEAKVNACKKGRCVELENSAFGVEHVEPVDVYFQVERSVKYGFLFIVLSFATFFLFEVLKGYQIHGVQYTLVGFAIALFYLLLLALSEHIAFVIAYGVATIACVSLLYVYLAAILHSHKHALAFATAYAVLYGVLYVIIQSEDFALLMGSVLTFICLGVVMLATRKVDWFDAANQLSQITRPNPAKQKNNTD